MKEVYSTPEFEVISLSTNDIVTSSPLNGGNSGAGEDIGCLLDT